MLPIPCQHALLKEGLSRCRGDRCRKFYRCTRAIMLKISSSCMSDHTCEWNARFPSLAPLYPEGHCNRTSLNMSMSLYISVVHDEPATSLCEQQVELTGHCPAWQAPLQGAGAGRRGPSCPTGVHRTSIPPLSHLGSLARLRKPWS